MANSLFIKATHRFTKKGKHHISFCPPYFLSSKTELPAAYAEAAAVVGAWMGRSGHTLVYGGARKGQMEVLAQAVKREGGRVIGVVPQVLVERNLVSHCVDVPLHCADLSERKAIMMRESEVFLILPGGIGTLDELFTVLAVNTLYAERRRVVLFNAGGCWDALLSLLDGLHAAGLVELPARETVDVVADVAALEALLKH